jgi:general secretion pathway protein D
VSYIETGIKLEVEPSVYLDDEVTIKLNLEVSNIVKEVRSTTTGTLAYQIGNRTANTVLRLKDGDTQILAGLIKDDDRRSDANVPGLSSLPIIGHLFSEKTDTREKTEIVLLITPHIVRNIPAQEASDAYVPFGTESSAGKQPMQVRPGAQTRITPGRSLGAGGQRLPSEPEVVPDDSFVPQEQEAVPGVDANPTEPAPVTPENGFKPLDAQPLQQTPTSPVPEPIPPT